MLLQLNGRHIKAISKKIHQEGSATRSQVAGNNTFSLYPDANIKCHRARILHTVLPCSGSPGLPVANDTVTPVCGCHLLPPSQVHSKCPFLVRMLMTSLKAVSFHPRTRRLFGSSQRCGRRLDLTDSTTSCCKWAQTLLRIQPEEKIVCIGSGTLLG